MPVLAQGNTLNLTLGAHDSITLQNRAGQSASLTVAGTLVNGQHSGTRTYGPYANGGAVVLTATAGDVYYEVGDGAYAGVSNALVQVDTTGRPIRTVTADGQVVGGGVQRLRTAVHAGDSRVAQGFGDDTTLAGTLTGSYSSRNWYQWLMLLSGQPLRLVNAAGVGGHRVSDFVARQNNPQGGSLFGKFAAPGWVPYAPGWLFLTLGINDILNNVPTATSIAGARAVLDAATRTGTIVVWPTELPVGPGGSQLTAGQAALLRAWNEGLMALRTEYHVLMVPDCYSAFLDTATGSALAGLHNDTSGAHVHLNNAGALLYAQTVHASISSELPTGGLLLPGDVNQVVSFDPVVNQYQVNPLLQGADATAALQSAVAFGAGATGTATLIDDPEGYGKAIQVDVTYTSTSSAFALLGFKTSTANFRGGECIVGALRVRVGRPGASPGLLDDSITPAFFVRCPEHLMTVRDAVADGDTVNSRQSLTFSTNDAGLRSGFSGVSATPPYQIKPGAPQSVQQQLYLRGIGAGSGPVRWIVSRAGIVRVPEPFRYQPAIG